MKAFINFGGALCCAVLVSCGAGQHADRVTKAPLPNWATADELARTRNLDLTDLSRSAPPPVGKVRAPAEFEPTRAVLLTYAGYHSMLENIAQSVAGSHTTVWMIGGPTSISGVDPSLYEPLNIAYDSVWARDYGPVGIDENSGTLALIDPVYRHYQTRPNDDAIPMEVSKRYNIKVYGLSLILDGGNFMTDGNGNLFMTERTLEWNNKVRRDLVEKQLKDYFGMQKIHWFHYAGSKGSPADGTGHIDMFAKILAPCKVLVASADAEPFHTPLEEAAQYFAALECDSTSGQKYQVARIKGWRSGSTWYTYTNSLVVNHVAIVPSYGLSADNEARAVYERMLPDYKVDLIDTSDSITAGGSIHCVTKEIPRG